MDQITFWNQGISSGFAKKTRNFYLQDNKRNHAWGRRAAFVYELTKKTKCSKTVTDPW